MSVLCRVVWVGLLLLSLTVIDQAAVSGQLLRRGCQPRCRTPLLQRLQLRCSSGSVLCSSCGPCACCCSVTGVLSGFCLRDELATGGGYSDYEAINCYGFGPNCTCSDLYTFHGNNTLDWAVDACCDNTLRDLDGPCFLVPPNVESSKGELVEITAGDNDLGRSHKYFRLRVGSGLERSLLEGEIKLGERPTDVKEAYCMVEHLGTDRLIKLFWIQTEGKPTGIGFEIDTDKVVKKLDVTYEQIGDDNLGMVYHETGNAGERQNYFVYLAKPKKE